MNLPLPVPALADALLGADKAGSLTLIQSEPASLNDERFHFSIKRNPSEHFMTKALARASWLCRAIDRQDESTAAGQLMKFSAAVAVAGMMKRYDARFR